MYVSLCFYLGLRLIFGTIFLTSYLACTIISPFTCQLFSPNPAAHLEAKSSSRACFAILPHLRSPLIMSVNQVPGDSRLTVILNCEPGMESMVSPYLTDARESYTYHFIHTVRRHQHRKACVSPCAVSRAKAASNRHSFKPVKQRLTHSVATAS